MRLLNITAVANSAGNRIDLTWTNPNPVGFPGVRVVRREHTHPLNPTDGVIVADGTGFLSASDTGLKGETAYYYSLFPFSGTPAVFAPDPHNRASALATAPYGFSGLMYSLLPALYHRYDEAQPPSSNPALTPADQQRGQLQRFLDLPGAQFDSMYSLARAALNLCDPQRVEGVLLPLLAQWIAWKTDYSLEVSGQRNEIVFAPYLFQTIGLIPTVETTVKRLTILPGGSGWESQTKEFVYNVARTNQPERLNLWFMQRPAAGAFGAAALASENFVYDWRPSAVAESDGSFSFFYQTYRNHGWDIWTKKFDPGQPSPWQPSAPVVDQPGVDTRPTAAMQGAILWLFWESYHPPANLNWQIQFQQRTAGVWSAPAAFSDAATPRRMPAAVADKAGGLWLFWLEQSAASWSLKYNHNDGTNWLAAPVTFPLDAGNDPRVEGDLIALFHPTSATQPIWLFWARHEPAATPGQSRWSIAYRFKQGLDPAVLDWSAVTELPKPSADNHDREPAPVVDSAGNIELFWSSTRSGGWTLWQDTLNIGTLLFGAPAQLTNTPYSNRAPLAVNTTAGTLLVFRSNQSLPHSSSVYRATQTLDVRYNGTTTVDTRNTAKIALFGKFEDFQTYTYDTGTNGVRTNNDRIARDTIGLYLTPDTADPVQIKATISRLAGALGDFMPVTERAVFITP